MDGGPFRTTRPAERGAASRPEAPRQPRQDPQPVSEKPVPTPRAAVSSHMPKGERPVRKWLLPAIVGVAVVTLVIISLLVWSNMRGAATAIDSSKYQAVFFTNGQVYFGKLHPFNHEYMKLTDVYYLQTQSAGEAGSENPQATSNNQSNVQLIKLGDEIHGPEDEMIIAKNQLLFYENLKPDGKVAQSIEKHKNSN